LFESVNYGLEWVAKSRATVTTTVSEGTRRWLPGIEHVVPCAVDTEMFRPGEVRAEKPTILFVAGRIGGRKRGDLVLAAFRDVRRRLPDAHMIMVTRDRIAEPGVEVRSAVSARELGELYRSSWVLCSASTYEGFGVPYAEALLSGLAIVTTANAGAREVLQDGRLGDIVADDGLADGLVRMLTDPERGDRYRAIGLEAAQQYRADLVAARYEAIYEEAISRLRRSTGAGSRRR
jgi:glycosyltransferase involved in cell wall biosynthesis